MQGPEHPASLPVVMVLVLSFGASAIEDKRTVMVPMRDGVGLSTHIFRAPGVARALPAILIRTPYGKGATLVAGYSVFIERGYAVVVQDVRGRHESGGVFRPLTQEENDGDDTLNWIARQPWSNGRIGMAGGSYVGIVQWKAALARNPHLKALFPVVSGYDDYVDRFYSRGGALKVGHRLSWIAENLRAPTHASVDFAQYIAHVPLRSSDQFATGRRVDFWQNALDHPAYDDHWRARSTRMRLDQVRVPVFSVAGWYDNFAQSDLEAFTALTRRSSAHRIVVGPWSHNMSATFSGVSYGRDSAAPVRLYQLHWFDHWVKPEKPVGQTAHPPVRIFVMGVNRWRDEQEWPLRRTRYTPMYLRSRSGAATLSGDGVLLPEPRASHRDEFTYDPRHPVLTRGGAVCCNPKIFPSGPMDQRAVETRPDVLVYTTDTLREDLEVTGAVQVVLYVSTSARDTDFTAKLVDVYPDGHARNLTDGIMRLRYRNSLERPELAKPGKVYRIAIDAGVTSSVFLAGHRLRLEVSSSNFPRFDRNSNTGNLRADDNGFTTAQQTVYHGLQYPSHVLLPVIPDTGVGRARQSRR